MMAVGQSMAQMPSFLHLLLSTVSNPIVASNEFLWHDPFIYPAFRAEIYFHTDDGCRLEPPILPASAIFLKRVCSQSASNPDMTQNGYH
jgi:hypothetical protein